MPEITVVTPGMTATSWRLPRPARIRTPSPQCAQNRGRHAVAGRRDGRAGLYHFSSSMGRGGLGTSDSVPHSVAALSAGQPGYTKGWSLPSARKSAPPPPGLGSYQNPDVRSHGTLSGRLSDTRNKEPVAAAGVPRYFGCDAPPGAGVASAAINLSSARRARSEKGPLGYSLRKASNASLVLAFFAVV